MESEKEMWNKKIYHLIIILFLSVCILLVGSKYLWTGHLNTTALGHTMNDQVGYVTAARNLVDTGKLESSLYYPALINYYKSHNLLYMPGNYYIRAFFFYIFGYSIFMAFLPNFLAFIGSAVLLFIIADQLFNRKTAYITSICFMLFPPFVLYAFSAMIELVFVFSCLLAFYIFINLPQKTRHIFGGLAILLPFSIRESATLMLPGLAIMIFFDYTDKRFQKVFWFTGISLILLYLVKFIPFISDIPPHFYLSLVNINALYTDAYILENIHLSYTDIIKILWDNFSQNINIFKALIISWQSWPVGFTFFVQILFLSLICMFITIKNKSIKKTFAYFTTITVSVILFITFSVYMYFVNSGVRQLLFMVPFILCTVFYAMLSSRISRRKGISYALLTVILIFCIFFFFISLQRFHNDFTNANIYAQKCNNFLDSIGVSNVNFFVAPHNISLDYVDRHYPIKWSFIPDNEKTLRLLTDKFPVDMLIIPFNHTLIYDRNSNKIKTTLLGDKFTITETRVFLDRTYFIFKPNHK